MDWLERWSAPAFQESGKIRRNKRHWIHAHDHLLSADLLPVVRSLTAFCGERPCMTPRELSFGWSMPVIGLVNPRRLNAGLVPTPSRLGEPVRAETLDVGRRTAIEQRFDQ